MKALVLLLPRTLLARVRGAVLAAQALRCPPLAGVYQLYRGRRLLHVGMAAGGAPCVPKCSLTHAETTAP